MMKKEGTVYSPTGILEDYLRSIESESGSGSGSFKESCLELEEEEEDKQVLKPISKWTSFVQLLKIRSRKPLGNLQSLSVSKLTKRLSSSFRDAISMAPSPILDNDLSYFKPHWKNFTQSELQIATGNFSPENQIGKGGYAEVYKGILKYGQLVAVKRLTRTPMDDKVGDFLSEIGIMAHLNHPNTAKLIGYGVEGGMYLVLELSPHGSLASLLHAPEAKLEWRIRYEVALGIAEGLIYLHEGCQRRIIHRDIKAANILLAEDYKPMICDFGLAKWLPEQWTHHTVSKFEGTFGYLAPEYLMHGIIDEKTDVFAFGVLLLELISGRRALDYSQQSLVLWARPLLKKNKIRELVDPSLNNDYDQLQMSLLVFAAFLCVQQSSIRRPRMSQVSELLSGKNGSMVIVKKCKLPCYWKRYYEDLLFTNSELLH